MIFGIQHTNHMMEYITDIEFVSNPINIPNIGIYNRNVTAANVSAKLRMIQILKSSILPL